jgi:hypothetical protein
MKLSILFTMLLLLLSSQTRAEDTWREYKIAQPKQDELQINYTDSRFVEISFFHDEPVNTTLEILDVSGKVVATLLDGEAGSAGIRWNSATVSRGVYFARLTRPQGVVSRKIVIMH